MWFKSKEKKQAELQEKVEQKKSKLQEKVDALNTKYEDEINSYCMNNNGIFIFKGFIIDDNCIQVVFKNKNCVEGYSKTLALDVWDWHYGQHDFERFRINFLEFKQDLAKINLKLEFLKP